MSSILNRIEPPLSVPAVHCSVWFCHVWMQMQAPRHHLQNPEYIPPAQNTMLSKVQPLAPQIILLKGILMTISEVLK